MNGPYKKLHFAPVYLVYLSACTVLISEQAILFDTLHMKYECKIKLCGRNKISISRSIMNMVIIYDQMYKRYHVTFTFLLIEFCFVHFISILFMEIEILSNRKH